MPRLPIGSTSFASVGELRAWLDSLEDVRLWSTPIQDDDSPWQLELEAVPTNPAFVALPPQRFVLHGEGRVEFELCGYSAYDVVEVADDAPALRLCVTEKATTNGTSSRTWCDSAVVAVEVLPVEDANQALAVAVYGAGTHELRTLGDLRWFEALSSLFVVGIRGKAPAFELLIEAEPREEEGIWTGRVWGELCVPEGFGEEPLHEGMKFRDGGLVDQVDTWDEDGRLFMRFLFHGGTVTLEGTVLRLALDGVRADDD